MRYYWTATGGDDAMAPHDFRSGLVNSSHGAFCPTLFLERRAVLSYITEELTGAEVILIVR